MRPCVSAETGNVRRVRAPVRARNLASRDNIGRVALELPASLTDREREVWQLHQQGMSTRSLAALRGVSRSAIRDTLARAEQKIALAERELAK